MSTPEAKLTPKQERAVLALLSARTLKEAAQSIQIGESTIVRWLATPRFRERYDTERRLLFDSAKNGLRTAAASAVQTLVNIQASDAPAGVRVTAARTILELCMRIQENDDVLLRLDRLEYIAEQKHER